MIQVKEKTECCGCHACYNVCPKKAICMERDEYGFEYPKVDKTKCINCGLCTKVCPILNNKKGEDKEIVTYACYNKNEEERKNSSSGGIFILLAREILNKGGVVFGACFDENYNVIHSYIETEKELKQIMTSKYVQSKIGDTYKKTKEFLENGRYVLFTGTPCQIEGLKAFLLKDYDNLYTQDIICHGVPSPKVWDKYKKYRKDKDLNVPQKVNFRNKDNGWKTFNMKFTYENDKFYRKNQYEDLFMQVFLKNICLRDSCYHCHFKKKNRISDITLADYWGIDEDFPEMYDDKGISLVLVNSEKGKNLFDKVLKKTINRKVDLERAVSHNQSYYQSVPCNTEREKFFNSLDKLGFDRLVKKYAIVPTYKRVLRKIKGMIKK